jgi:hypothetical protein
VALNGSFDVFFGDHGFISLIGDETTDFGHWNGDVYSIVG